MRSRDALAAGVFNLHGVYGSANGTQLITPATAASYDGVLSD